MLENDFCNIALGNISINTPPNQKQKFIITENGIYVGIC